MTYDMDSGLFQDTFMTWFLSLSQVLRLIVFKTRDHALKRGKSLEFKFVGALSRFSKPIIINESMSALRSQMNHLWWSVEYFVCGASKRRFAGHNVCNETVVDAACSTKQVALSAVGKREAGWGGLLFAIKIFFGWGYRTSKRMNMPYFLMNSICSFKKHLT